MRGLVLSPTVLTVAAAYGFAAELAARAGIFGALLFVLVMLSLWRYCYALLGMAALGRRNPPAPDIDSVNPAGEWAPVLHAAFFFFAIVLLVTTPLLGDSVPAMLGRVGGLVVLVGVFPASAAIMGVARNPAAALDPRGIATVIGVLGRDYAKLIGTLAALVILASLAASLAGASVAGGVVASVIAVWAQLAVYATIGNAIRVHGDEFDLDGDDERRTRQDERDRDRVRQAQLDNAYGSIRGGLVEQGYGTIRQLVEAEGDSLEIHEWLFDRMSAWEDCSHAIAFAPRFVEGLVEAGRLHEALDLADECRRIGGRQLTLDARVVDRLVDYARSINRHRSADELAALGAADAP